MTKIPPISPAMPVPLAPVLSAGSFARGAGAGLPGVVFDPSARGSQAFVAFASELVEKMPPASMFAPLSASSSASPKAGKGSDRKIDAARPVEGADASDAADAAPRPAASAPESA